MLRLFRSLVPALFLLMPLAARADDILADPLPSQGPFTVSGTVPGVTLEPVATSLDPVTSITHAGDDRVFLTLRPGRIVILTGGAVKPQAFLDIRSLVNDNGEGGLLSVAFHPHYAQNGFLFVNYTNSIPADNPFRGLGDPPDEIWATGLRNPWRFSFDRQTGDLWIGDVGQGRREEVDFQPAGSRGGENYGWKVMEGTLCSSSDACPASTPRCDSAVYTSPVLEFDHDPYCSITGGYVYRGARLPQLQGTYFFGDFCTGTIWAASRQGTGFTVRSLAGEVPEEALCPWPGTGTATAATASASMIRWWASSCCATASRRVARRFSSGLVRSGIRGSRSRGCGKEGP